MKSPLLVNASDEYKRTILSGARITLNTILLQIIAGFLIIALSMLSLTLGPTGGFGSVIKILTMMNLVFDAILLVGAWRLSALDPRDATRDAGQGINAAIRIVAITRFALALLSTANAELVWLLDPTVAKVVNLVLPVATIVASTTNMSLISFLLVRLGERVPDQFIVRRARKYRWMLPLFMTVGLLFLGLGQLIGLILYWNLLDRFRKHMTSIISTGQPAVHLKLYAG